MLSVSPDPVVVERMLVGGQLRCPDCGGVLSRWGHAAARFVRLAAGVVERIRPRRAICPATNTAGCGRSHVLLPRFLLGRRLDEVEVIWSALRRRADGSGWRSTVAAVGRPASTVRGWLERAARLADAIRDRFAEVEYLVAAAEGGDMDRVAPTGSGLGDALAQVGACLAVLRRSRGEAVRAVSPAQLVAVLSGGWLLGTRILPVPALSINMFPRL